jgi:hypothetical protein
MQGRECCLRDCEVILLQLLAAGAPTRAVVDRWAYCNVDMVLNGEELAHWGYCVRAASCNSWPALAALLHCIPAKASHDSEVRFQSHVVRLECSDWHFDRAAAWFWWQRCCFLKGSFRLILYLLQSQRLACQEY